LREGTIDAGIEEDARDEEIRVDRRQQGEVKKRGKNVYDLKARRGEENGTEKECCS